MIDLLCTNVTFNEPFYISTSCIYTERKRERLRETERERERERRDQICLKEFKQFTIVQYEGISEIGLSLHFNIWLISCKLNN